MSVQQARELRRQMTDAERKLWQRLRGRRLGGTKWRRQHPQDQYILDFYCHALRLAVELDGPGHRAERHRARDARRDAWLQSKRIRVVRVSNEVFETNVEQFLQNLLHMIEQRRVELQR